jgi:hypothetical protein
MGEFKEFKEICLQYSTIEDKVRFALVSLLRIYHCLKMEKEYSHACDELMQVDPIRKKYWEYKKNRF